MNLAAELANQRIADSHVADLHSLTAMFASDRNHDGFLTQLLTNASYLSEKNLSQNEYLGHMFMTDVQTLFNTLDTELKIQLLNLVVALTELNAQRQAVSNYSILSQIKTTLQQAFNRVFDRNQAVKYACIRALINFMKDAPTRFLLVQFLSTANLL